MLLKTMQFSNSTLQFRSKMQFFTICTKLMIKTQKTKNVKQCKMPIFCIFNISELKMHGLKNNLIYKPTVYKTKTTQAEYQAAKHLAQCTRTIKMKR